MPISVGADLLSRVSALLRARAEGLTLAELHGALQGTVARRTLQRRLEEWLRAGAVLAKGVRRGRRYLPPHAQTAPTGAPTSIPLSAAAQDILALVSRPLADRQPVGYRREFLGHYVPNLSAYLTPAMRTHLHRLGRTTIGDQPAGTYARDILDRLLIDLSWSSSRLEGNTYSLLDTRELLERGTAAPGKDAKETQMILNHKAAIELLVTEGDDVGVNRYTLTNLHALLADNLLEDARHTGRIRTTPVGIGASTYVPSAIPQVIEDAFNQLIDIGAAIQDPFEQSFFLMVHIPYLQPFVDVNKRTSRLAANIPLIRRNFMPLSFVDVPEELYVAGLVGIYETCRMELLRDVYLWAYERSVRQYKTVRDSLPEPDPFRLRYREALTEIVGDVIRGKIAPKELAIAERAVHLVDASDLPAFAQLAAKELADLHEGNIARYRVRPSEFRQWLSQRASAIAAR